jgi:hypothetical protein
MSYAMSRKISVVCLKWGTPYPAEYVNVLQKAVAEKLRSPHRFICITDTPEGLSSGVTIMPLPDIPIDRAKWRSGYWPKLAMFKRGFFTEDEIILYLDVDILIEEDLDSFIDLIERQRGLRIIREWNPDIWRLVPDYLRPDRGGNGSVIGFVAGEQWHLFDDFVKDPYGVDSVWGIDQVYITQRAASRRYWPSGWCVSFRRSCVPHWPLNLLRTAIRKAANAKIFVFHGIPNPTDMVADGNYRWGTKWRYGIGPVEWVQDYWRKHTSGTRAD